MQNVVAGQRTFFATSSIAGRRNLLQSSRASQLFVDVLQDYRQQGKYLLHEFVVMPNHFHVLLTVGSNMAVERALQFIKGGFSFRAARELAFGPPVWQKGFSEIRTLDRLAFERQRNYIRENPVRRGLVAHPQEWLFSSASSCFELDPTPQWLKPLVSNLPGTPEGVP
jgi:putative transposase